MKSKLLYSFDDEPVSKFCYDLDNKKIEVHFKGYYDFVTDMDIEGYFVWVIEDWKEAKSKIGDDPKTYDLNKNIGIFSMILHMEIQEGNLEMVVNTIDNRYITFIFSDPKLSLK